MSDKKCIKCDSQVELKKHEDYEWVDSHWKKTYFYQCDTCSEKEYDLHLEHLTEFFLNQ